MSDSETNHLVDPPVTPRDSACAVLARAALFPMRVDWAGQHQAIHPALAALDLVRQDVIRRHSVTSFSKLFPRHVIVVPAPDGSMQWNGQPDIVDSTVEVIPNILSVKCMECSNDIKKGVKAFVRAKKDDKFASTNSHPEIVLCTNRLLQSDYDESKDPTLLKQRRDLPQRSYAAVDEILAHEITKIRVEQSVSSNPRDAPCERLAELEIQAARAAECLFQKQGNEVHRGSVLRPAPGFSLLLGGLQQNFQNRCVRAVATEATSREFGKEGRKCVDEILLRRSSTQ
jgi:hypothetical protein